MNDSLMPLDYETISNRLRLYRAAAISKGFKHKYNVVFNRYHWSMVRGRELTARYMPLDNGMIIACSAKGVGG